MCGVAGIFRFDGRPIALELLRTMSAALAHRGPDGEGHELLGPCGLAHRRLAIIDLSESGHQPMSSADGRYWLSYNGEIYNYLELKSELEARGHRFRTATDSEVILAAYEAWGEAAFSRFNGMWGLAIWDQHSRELLLSRDRMGVKPLYFALDPQRVLFASEIKALLAAEPELAVADVRSMARFFASPTFCFHEATFFQGVSQLPPATTLRFRADGSSQRSRYWSFKPSTPHVRSRDAAVSEVRELLIDAVRLRFRSDVPVGTCLSGGLDSSSIVSIAAKLGKAPETFSVVFDDPDCDEREFIDHMTRAHGSNAQRVMPDGQDFADVISRATYHQDSPAIAHGTYSQWHVMKMAAPRVKVLLDGQGGDELFGGYHSYFFPAYRSLLQAAAAGELGAVAALAHMQQEVRALSGEDLFARLRGEWRARARGRWTTAKRGVRSAMGRWAPPFRKPRTEVEGPGSSRLTLMIRAEYRDPIQDERPSWATEPVTGDPLTDHMWHSLVKTSIPQLLHYEDRASMAFSIEARTPFLDYRLIECAFGLPNALKIDGANTKVVLREAMRGILPEPVRTRRDKKGYPTPFLRWSRSTLRSLVGDLLLSPRLAERPYVDPGPVRRAVEDHLAGKRDNTSLVFQLLSFELFHRRFLDGPFAPEISATPPL